MYQATDKLLAISGLATAAMLFFIIRENAVYATYSSVAGLVFGIAGVLELLKAERLEKQAMEAPEGEALPEEEQAEEELMQQFSDTGSTWKAAVLQRYEDSERNKQQEPNPEVIHGEAS